MKQFTITLEESQLNLIAQAIMELPKRVADPLLAELQKQVNA